MAKYNKLTISITEQERDLVNELKRRNYNFHKLFKLFLNEAIENSSDFEDITLECKGGDDLSNLTP